MLRTCLGWILAGLMLTGCGALSALDEATTPLDAYDMTAPAQVPQARGQVARDLVVEVPSAAGALDSDRILIRPNPLQAQYLPRSRWSEPAPAMAQTLILRTLENTNAFRYVGRRPLGGAGDYALVSDLTDFQAELAADGESAVVRLRLVARLVREEDAAVLASRSFTASAAAPGLDTLVVVDAYNRAGQVLLADLAAWVLRSLSITATAPAG